MHAEALGFVTEAVERLGPFESVLEIGSRNVNGGVRHLFGSDYIGLDIAPGEGVDLVADAASWRPDRTFACVVCCETFEHTPTWPDICVTARAALGARGVFILTMGGPGRAPHSATDGGALRPDEHYENVGPDELRLVLEQHFARVEVVERPPDLYATARR